MHRALMGQLTVDFIATDGDTAYPPLATMEAVLRGIETIVFQAA
jgi:hypothetical protein